MAGRADRWGACGARGSGAYSTLKAQTAMIAHSRLASEARRFESLASPRRIILPTPASIKKRERTLGREVVAGFTEGLARSGNRRDGGFGGASQQASFPEEVTATVVVQFPDGSVQELRDQILRLEQQDR